MNRTIDKCVGYFDLVIEYLEREKSGVNDSSLMIKNKACFEINNMLPYKEDYDKAKRNIDAYPFVKVYYTIVMKMDLFCPVWKGKNPKLMPTEKLDMYKALDNIGKYAFILKHQIDYWRNDDAVMYPLLIIDDIFDDVDLMRYELTKYKNYTKFKNIIYGMHEVEHFISFIILGFIEDYQATELVKGLLDLLEESLDYETDEAVIKKLIESHFEVSILEFDEEQEATYVVKISNYKSSEIVEISSDSFLSDLNFKIQKLFDLENDHMYGFTLGNRFWGLEPIAEGNPEYVMRDMEIGKLYRYQRLTYVHDYGDSNEFTIDVMDVKKN